MLIAQYLLVKHGVLPGRFYQRPEGERLMIRALLLDYLERKGE